MGRGVTGKIMSLTVKVIKYRGQIPHKPLEASYEQDGFTIGRSSDRHNNHLLLPDPDRFISRRHASIIYKNGAYHLTDSSVDGTYIQNRNRHVHGETVPLSDQDLLKIGDYEIIVHIASNESSESDFQVEPKEEFDNEFFFDSGQDRQKKNTHHEEDPGGIDNAQWWLDRDDASKGTGRSYFSDPAEESPLNSFFTSPEFVDESAQEEIIPEDFNPQDLFGDLNGMPANTAEADVQTEPLNPSPVSGAPLENTNGLPGKADPQGDVSISGPSSASITTSAPSNHRQVKRELVQQFLEAAGLSDLSFLEGEDPSKIMRTTGAMVRELVKGLMVVLSGRTELKSQFKVPLTAIKPTENNPLKFYKNVEDALQQLIEQKQPGFIGALDAVRDGYSDVMNHQLALTAGVQAAVIQLIERFDPEIFSKTFGEGVVFQKKAKAWDAYQQSYADIADDAFEDFYGEAFIRAYEAQIRKLNVIKDS